jgi:hypothetical protein
MTAVQSPFGGGIVAANLTNLLMPTGALAETFPRIGATTNFVITSGQSVIGAIPLPAGTKVSNITVCTGISAETGGTHGWVALCSAAGTVLGVSADQGATWLSPGNTLITTALTAPYTVTAAGTYYVVLGLTATGPPQLCVFTGGAVAGATGQTPFLGGNAGISGAPPALSSILTYNSNNNSLYAYVS